MVVAVYGGVRMVYCQNCGKENEDNATFCQNCGTRMRPKENKTGILKLINWKALIFGGLTWIILLVIFAVYFSYVIPNPDISSAIYIISFLLFVQFISGIIIGFISGKSYESGILQGAIVGAFYSIFFLFAGISSFIGAIVLLPVFGLIGSLLGVLIYRKYNNYDLVG